MTEPQEVTFTDLLQRSTETVEKLKHSRTHALRVRRRGGEDDLILTTAAPAAQDEQVVEIAIRLLRAITGDPIMRANHLLDVLPQVFRWIRFLPAGNQLEFVREFIDVMSAGEELDSPAPVLQTITEWRNTAQVYADPELLVILRAQPLDDAGEVPAPVPPVS
jgi:hypothetical protein